MSDLLTTIPVTVVTGFLGSGKTTMLSSLLKKEEMKNTAVIINEFGEIGLDHALIEKSDENILELKSGCICCTIRSDLHDTLLTLAEKMAQGDISPFNKVVIETTGLADPAPIIHTLMTSFDLQRIFKLDGVVTLVDAVNGEATLDSQQESVKQAALAERIILSKTDLADEATQKSLVRRLKAINPAVTIITGNHGDVPVSAIIGLGTYDPYNKSQDVKEWLAAEKYEESHNHSHDHGHHHHHDVNRHDKNIRAFTMKSEKPVDIKAFSFFLQLLGGQVDQDLLRVKGIINVEGESRPAVIHGVQHIFHPLQWLDKWPDDDHSTRLVFITRNIEKEQVEKFFHALIGFAEKTVSPREVAEAWVKI